MVLLKNRNPIGFRVGSRSLFGLDRREPYGSGRATEEPLRADFYPEGGDICLLLEDTYHRGNETVNWVNMGNVGMGIPTGRTVVEVILGVPGVTKPQSHGGFAYPGYGLALPDRKKYFLDARLVAYLKESIRP